MHVSNLQYSTILVQRCHVVRFFKFRGARSNVVDIIRLSGWNRVTEIPNFRWAKAHPAHLLTKSLLCASAVVMNAVFFVRYMKLILPSKYHASIQWVWIFYGGACSFIHLLLLIKTLWILRIFQTMYFDLHRIRKRIPNFIWQNFFANQNNCVCTFFFKTIWLVKNFVKLELLF